MPGIQEWRAAREETSKAEPPFELKMEDGHAIQFARAIPLAVAAYLSEGQIRQAVAVWVGEENADLLLKAGLTVEEFKSLITEATGDPTIVGGS